MPARMRWLRDKTNSQTARRWVTGVFYAGLLFVTIACGAISGFHCLVSSGTSSKQVEQTRGAPLSC